MKTLRVFALFLISGLLFASCGANGGSGNEPFFKTRGVIVAWDDVKNPEVIDWLDIMGRTGLNTISVFGSENTPEYAEFKQKCADMGIAFEYEDHAMTRLLPRELFESHPEYFRMDKDGNRVADGNGCPSCQEALKVMRENVAAFMESRTPTNHKYYTWLFDGGDVCHCPLCEGLGVSDQALMFENEIIKALREKDPEAQLAHLAYHNGAEAPRVVKPAEGIFLEYAPFFRRWDAPLCDTTAVSERTCYGQTHADFMRMLKENLEVFPVETAQVLEYWMDDSLVSDWKKPQKQLTFHNDVFRQDLATYASLGIRHITCYGAWIDADYVKAYGYPSFIEDYGNGLKNFKLAE